MNTSHTPGPWEFHEEGEIRASGALVACVYGPDDFPCAEEDTDGQWAAECQANARLIAAAPALLEVLDALVALAETSDDCAPPNDLYVQVFIARELLAEVNGTKGGGQ